MSTPNHAPDPTHIAQELIRLATAVRLGSTTFTTTQLYFFSALLPSKDRYRFPRLFDAAAARMIRAPGHLGISHHAGVRVTLLLERGPAPSDVAHRIEHESDD